MTCSQNLTVNNSACILFELAQNYLLKKMSLFKDNIG